MSLQCGHFGLVVGSRALAHVWPTVSQWVKWKSGESTAPDNIEQVDADSKLGVRQGHGKAVDETLSGALKDLLSDAFENTGDTLREMTDVMRWVRWQMPRLLRLVNVRGAGLSMGHILDEQARQIGHDTFFMWSDMAYSFAEANVRVNRIANALDKIGVKQGDHVGIMMDNHPDYLACLGAFSRMGVVGVLLNPGVRGDVLEHALEAGEVGRLIVAENHLEGVLEVVDKDRLIVTGPGSQHDGVESLEDLVSTTSDTLAAHLPRNPGRPEDLALLMFTSGTTGLPKAARISNRRWFMAGTASAAAAGLNPDDTVYCTLPLYHATGLLLGAGGALVSGCRLALGAKFSVSKFWDDVHRTGATVVFYVGELCRYLVSAPELANEKNHSIRLFIGNGLRADVWGQLRNRYGRVRVCEFYGSTEGNVVLANITGHKIGSVGRVPFNLQQVELVKYRVDEDEYVRDHQGFMIPCSTNEPGMLISQIQVNNPFSHFDGYTDSQATERKVLRDVFEPGDCWFASGDLLRKDIDGDFWFEDRVGDTYRYKGENVSTEEVSRVVTRAACIELATVYGVKIADHEGRVGTAAIQMSDGQEFEAKAVFDVIETGLAPAARPRFIRVVEELQTTASFKVIKHHLQKEGVNPSKIQGDVYWYDSQQRTYTKLTAKDYASVMTKI
ncbi:MAG: long-chain-acyl-CoA synthetase [Deltaproteobacteria bacterium]|nr:long-chain-acyl-CoA synthetase [Deltaproteobacteria bacterium]